MLPITGKIILSNNNLTRLFSRDFCGTKERQMPDTTGLSFSQVTCRSLFALFFDVIWTCFAQYFHIFAHPLHTLCVRTHLLNSLQINIDIFYSLEILFMEIWFFLMTLMSEKIVWSYIMLMWSQHQAQKPQLRQLILD